MASSFFSLNQIPLPGIEDMSQTARELHAKWVWQLHIVRGLKAIDKQSPLGPFLRTHLDSLDFLCGLALAQLERRLGASTSWEPAGHAGGIMEITQAFIEEVPRAREAWNEWLGRGGGRGPDSDGRRTPASAKSAERSSPALGCFGGFGAAEPDETETKLTQVTQELQEFTKPRPIEAYWGKLAAVAALGFLAYVIRG